MKRLLILCVGFFCLATCLNAGDTNSLRLWYTAPATVWNEALPVGNGRIGAMCFGSPASERIQLNEDTYWSGCPSRNDNPKALSVLYQVRSLIFANNYTNVEDIINKNITAQTLHGSKYLCVGNLKLDFTGHSSYTDYERELDISNALWHVKYKVGDVEYRREVFASVPDQVLVMRLTASEAGKLTFKASLSGDQQQSIAATASNEIVMSCKGVDHEGVQGKVMCSTRVKVIPKGGSITRSGAVVNVSKADEVLILVSMATNHTNYKSLTTNQTAKAKGFMDEAATKSYDELLAAHLEAYHSQFDRVTFDLGFDDEDATPTDQRLKDFSKKTDLLLPVIFYQYGRYLLISSSQPGCEPANLQGMWNDVAWPVWDSKYTININLEMNYWPAEKTNLSELHEPLIRLVKDLSEAGQKTASTMYGCRGWVAHHNTDIWRICGVVDMASSGMWPSGSAWLTQHLWEHYIYTGDLDFLREVYPVMRGASLFYVDFLVKDPRSNYLVSCPSNSPENTPWGHSPTSVNGGITMDNQLLFDLFTKTIRAARLLDVDQAFCDTLQQKLDSISPMRIGQYGQLQEWQDDWDSPDDKHRHVSHLYGMYPSNQISPFTQPKLFNAVNRTLQHRGDPATGWSMGWKINLWARMLNGNHAYTLIKNQLHYIDPVNNPNNEGGTYPNLLDAHPPFQIDGNFGYTSGVTEMLMQTQDGTIHLLPALPSVWKKQGKVTGLKAYGGFIVDIEWASGKIVKARITSTLGGNCRVRLLQNDLQLKDGTLTAATGTNPNPFFETPTIKNPIISPQATMTNLKAPTTYVYDFETQAGETYVLTTEANGVRSVTSSPVVKTEYYTLDGRKTSLPTRGVNIVRTEDGKTFKVIF